MTPKSVVINTALTGSGASATSRLGVSRPVLKSQERGILKGTKGIRSSKFHTGSESEDDDIGKDTVHRGEQKLVL